MKHMKWMTTSLFLSVVVFIGLAGCTSMAPTYSQPAAPVPDKWPDGSSYRVENAKPVQKQLADIGWQEFYQDGRLQQIMTLALENNRDLRVATLNIERSLQLYRIQRSTLSPQVDAKASGTFERLSEDFAGTGTRDIHQYYVGLGVSSYELDLFGRVRSLKDQALEQYLATEQAQRSVQIGLVSQIAVGYLTLAADRELSQLAKETLETQLASYRLIQRRFEMGVSSELDLRQAQAQVDTARMDALRFTTLVAQDENNLDLMAGTKIQSDLLPQTLAETITAVQDISPGLPSDVLLRRPDIIQAENLLKGYNASIGAARAAFFPRITLVGSMGVGSNDLSTLFQSGSGGWTFVPQIVLPIFDAGARSAQLKVAEVDRDIAIAQYEKAIQTAFREVADALAQRGTIDEQIAAQQSLVKATDKTYILSRSRYEKGIDNYLSVLDAQRSLYSAQKQMIAIRLARLINQVSLYKVLGGGWQE